MNCLRWILLFLSIVPSRSVFAVEPAAPPSVYRITGVVVSSIDDAPIAHAHLSATIAAQREPRMMGRFLPHSGIDTDADDHGRFTLTLPSPGTWSLLASAPGFVTQALDEHENYSSAVVLSASEPAIDLHFRLPPEAAITGVIFDEAGEAVRNARVTLQRRAPALPDHSEQIFQNRMTTQSDDRGIYEFDNLSAGDYRVLVDAKPWYSDYGQSASIGLTKDETPFNPSLDVTYQHSWYPGVDDPAQAEIISLHAADNRTADFHLVPIPAVHLKFTAPVSSGPEGRPIPVFPMLERMDAGNAPGIVPLTSLRRSAEGQTDIGGLAPGLYRIRLQGQQGGAPQWSVVEITSGSSRTIDLGASSSTMADLSFDLKSDQEESPLNLVLRNTETGARFSAFGPNMFLSANSRMGSSQKGAGPADIQVPPGRYEVLLMGRGSSYLTGISAKGAEVSGRFVTVHAGNATLIVHTANGHATVQGVVTANSKPIMGAIVLLVPAGLDDPGSFTRLVRDQTNTDGSFDLNDIVPGPYILVAVDHGWNINWNDATTLQRYLTQGTPLDLHANASLKQDIVAQRP